MGYFTVDKDTGEIMLHKTDSAVRGAISQGHFDTMEGFARENAAKAQALKDAAMKEKYRSEIEAEIEAEREREQIKTKSVKAKKAKDEKE